MARVPGSIEVGQLVRDIEEEIFEALDDAVNDTIVLGTRYAKRLAPVRKVSYLTRNRRTRSLSRAEVASLPSLIRASAQRIQRRGGRVLTTIRQSRQQLPTPELGYDDITERATGLKKMSRAGVPQSLSDLTHRGRQELSMAKRFRAGGRSAAYTTGRGTNRITTLGGRLRGEIEAIPPSRRGGRITGKIESPTPYARFVEFPTSRTAAQPYMRPTLKYLKRPFIAKVHSSLKSRGFRPI